MRVVRRGVWLACVLRVGAMVQFGRHLRYLRQRVRKEVYLVDYEALKALLGDEAVFVRGWEAGLSSACAQHAALAQDVWGAVFEADLDGHGSRPGDALRRYAELRGASAAWGVCNRYFEYRTAAEANREALRKLVKKYDKNRVGGARRLGGRLLPRLYASNIAFTDAALDGFRAELRERTLAGSLSLENSASVQAGLQQADLDEASLFNLRQASGWVGEGVEERGVGLRAEEMAWLRSTVKGLPQGMRETLVAHRGFHSASDRTDARPLENTLDAYEAAWASGLTHAECDVAVTKDGVIVLCHDSGGFERVALKVPGSGRRERALRVGDLTFAEIMALPLKSGARPPLLEDVLRSARHLGADRRLVVEIKPGNVTACKAIVQTFSQQPHLLSAVAVFMSFDAYLMDTLAKELEPLRDLAHAGGDDDLDVIVEGYDDDDVPPSTTPFPKLMLLTVSEPDPDLPFEVLFDVLGDPAPVDKATSNLDGLYVQYQASMVTDAGALALRRATTTKTIGVWGYADKDPDDLNTATFLADNGVSFVNTDLPRSFRGGGPGAYSDDLSDDGGADSPRPGSESDWSFTHT